MDEIACGGRRSHTDAVTRETPLADSHRYPKLRPQNPVLHRAAGEVQVGIDSDTALIFSEPKLVPVLLALDGGHHVRDIRDAGAAAGVRADEVDEVVQVLDGANMLLEAGHSSCSPEVRQSVRLIGDGPLSAAIATLLAQSRLGRLWLVDTDPKEGNHGQTDGARASRLERLRGRLTSEFQIQMATVSHWSRPSSTEVDLTVMVSEAAEADRLVADDLVRMDQPHLIVRPAGDLVTVGPLVMPGRTACLRCTDLTRRDADAAWPALLDQLTRLRLPTSAALSAWAVSITVTQALAFLRGGTPEAGSSTLELSQHDLVTRRRTWPVHPNCGCHWLSAGQWSA